jgi:thymidylate synthase
MVLCLCPKDFNFIPIEFNPTPGFRFDFTTYDEKTFICLSSNVKFKYIVISRENTDIDVSNLILSRASCVAMSSGFDLYALTSEEGLYLQLMQRVSEKGAFKPDRTGVGTNSTFGERLEFSLRNGVIPVMTTKKVYFRGVVEELLWFLRGSTDTKELERLGVNFWNQNGSKKNLEKLGFVNRSEGDLGPVYGFQWRHWGKTYVDTHTRNGKGEDQIRNLIDGLKNNPYSRRHILSAWNVSDLSKMALPPCHVCCQFYVSTERELSCMLFQRSADLFLGVPFNIVSYALLTHILAKMTQLKPGKLIMNFGDTHVYVNHKDAVREQCFRSVENNFPTVVLPDDISLETISSENIHLINYIAQPKISAEMAV